MKELQFSKFWIFDLDNTLYSGKTRVFEQIDKRMSKYISGKLNVSIVEAKEIQKKYFYKYNTTLNGMLKNHKIDANEFLEFVHDIDIDFLKKDLILSEELRKLEGKKIIFTNGSRKHALNIIRKIGIDQYFDDIFDIVDANFIPKPTMEPYKKLVEKHKIDPNLCVFIEDIARNLKPAYEMGMKTVWIENDEPWAVKFSDSDFINYKIKNLTEFLKKINFIKSCLMNIKSFEKIINEAWDEKGKVNSKSSRKLLNAISKTIDLLDSGEMRVAEKKNNEWIVNQWIKKAILLSFRVNKMKTSKGPYATWYDKVEGKTQKWNEKKLIQAGFRFVPNGVVRKGAFIAKKCYLDAFICKSWSLC